LLLFCCFCCCSCCCCFWWWWWWWWWWWCSCCCCCRCFLLLLFVMLWWWWRLVVAREQIANDGTFWMSFDDFLAHYTEVEVAKCHGSWESATVPKLCVQPGMYMQQPWLTRACGIYFAEFVTWCVVICRRTGRTSKKWPWLSTVLSWRRLLRRRNQRRSRATAGEDHVDVRYK
jgi:hypothetical protein